MDMSVVERMPQILKTLRRGIHGNMCFDCEFEDECNPYREVEGYIGCRAIEHAVALIEGLQAQSELDKKTLSDHAAVVRERDAAISDLEKLMLDPSGERSCSLCSRDHKDCTEHFMKCKPVWKGMKKVDGHEHT